MKIIDTKDIGIMIRNKRKQLQYSQEFLSKNTGLSMSFISNIENGKETCEIGKVLKLAQVLGLDFFMEERI